MATGQEWINYFKKLSPIKKNKIKRALKDLESDKMLKQEYGWTGLFSLKHLMNEK